MAVCVYIDGEYYSKEDAKISVLDHAVLYGDGVFEGIRFYDRNVFRLEQHLERLESSAKYIMLKPPLGREKMTEAILETCRRSGLENGYIRLVLTRGVGEMSLSPFKCSNPSVIIIVTEVRLYPNEYYENGLPIIVAATRRFSADSLSPRVKSLNYLNNIMAKVEAIHAGVLEALMLDAQGYVVECTGDNIFIVKDGVLTTPPAYMGALKGITRDAVIEIAREAGYTVQEQPFTLYECYEADEVFLTGTAAEVVPVIDIDQRIVSDGKPGPIYRKLAARFAEMTKVDGVRF